LLVDKQKGLFVVVDEQAVAHGDTDECTQLRRASRETEMRTLAAIDANIRAANAAGSPRRELIARLVRSLAP
jgi:hypothetical protein